ncbi:MAG: MBL fold metallo-hydrolase [Lachnospiraceae bacterium]|nr:MBL fold metallo-hydrolase [Lachnospiraceae bacterium]
MSVEFIDFSCKHNILIKNPDGSFSPMDEPYFEVEQIDDTTWKILTSGDYTYLIAGDGEAMAFDTGYGAGNIRRYMESVCHLPVECAINSHDHFDHTAGNPYFEKVYMTEKGAKYATIPYPSFDGIDFHADEYERVVVHDGDIIPLKGRELEVIEIQDHAPSSLMVLDRKNRILFSGDEIFGAPFKPLGRGLTSWVNGLRKIKDHIDEFDFALGGNGKLPKEHVLGFINVAEYALAHPEEAVKPEPRKGGPGGPPAFPDHDGHTVYDRMFPHSGDRTTYDPEDRPKAKPENMVMLEKDGYRIGFDITLINE